MSTVSLASNAADSDALESIEHHHAELVGGLAARTSALLASVRGGRGWQEERDVLAAWCLAELVPHAEAEEAVLYPAAKELPELETLIRAMSREHTLLGDLVARLQAAVDAPAALAHAGAAQSLFESHVEKENDLVLPALVASPAVSVSRLLSEMAAELATPGGEVETTAAGSAHESRADDGGHTCACHDEAGDTPQLDAREIPHAIRHATIFGALDAVPPAADLILIAPHDPLPLLAQIEQRAPGRFAVEYLERGPEAWRLRFTRPPQSVVPA